MPEDIIAEEQPEEVVEIVEELPPAKEAKKNDLSDLFEVPHREDADIKSDDLVSLTEEDVFGEGGADMSDLTDVSKEDIMGEEYPLTPSSPPPRRVIRRVIRTSKPYRSTPPTGMGELRS